jgi:hypothetical protein
LNPCEAYGLGVSLRTMQEGELLPAAKLRIDIRPDQRDWVLRHGLWGIGIFGDTKARWRKAFE